LIVRAIAAKLSWSKTFRQRKCADSYYVLFINWQCVMRITKRHLFIFNALLKQKCSVLQTDAKQSYWLGNTPSTKQNKNKKTAF